MEPTLNIGLNIGSTEMPEPELTSPIDSGIAVRYGE
jgi:hypothetical protein